MGRGTRKQPYAEGRAFDNTSTASRRRSVVDNSKKTDNNRYNVHNGATTGDKNFANKPGGFKEEM